MRGRGLGALHFRKIVSAGTETGGAAEEIRLMTTATLQAAPQPRPLTKPTYLADGKTIRSWLLTTDHKRIAILYMISITLFFFIGGAAATMMRLELLTPQGDLVTSETYNKLFTIHGVVMVWFFLIPSIPTVLGNFLVPLMIGARDVAFPKLNLASWYLFMAGGAFAVFSIITGGVDTGWTFYTPYSSTYANGHVIAMATGIFIAGFGSIATGLNFIVTIHKMRAPGLTWFRLPMFIWTIYTTSLILVLATPGAGHHPHADGAGACVRRRDFQPGDGRRPAPLSTPLLVLLAPGSLHHDPARDGRGQ